MTRICKKGFTLIELLVVISIIALLIGLLMPALGAANTAASKLENATNQKGILTAFFGTASSKRGWLLGFNGRTYLDGADISIDGAAQAGSGSATHVRFAALLAKGDMVPESLISPAEKDPAFNPYENGVFAKTNASYALLGIGNETGAKPASARSWRSAGSSNTPLISDRNLGKLGDGLSGVAANYHSNYSKDGSKNSWIGAVGSADGHVETVSRPVMKRTTYGSWTKVAPDSGKLGYAGKKGRNGGDNLFTNEDSGKDGSLVGGKKSGGKPPRP